jgi:transposase
VSDGLDPAPRPEGLGIAVEEWPQSPVRARLVGLTLLQRLTTLEARWHQHSSNASRPPSTEAPATKRQRRRPAAERRQPGGKHGHPGHPQVLLEPTATVSLFPEGCACGHREVVALPPYHTHQVLELPVMRPDVTHWLRPQGQCLSCGKRCKAPVPADQGRGDGPRLTGFVGERAGMVGASRSAVQDLCPAVFGIPLSQGAIQKMVDRVSAAILPHYTAFGEVAHASLVHDIDETSWLTGGARRWLWGMANPLVASFQIHPHRSKGACAQRIADWTGLLVRDGSLVSQSWQGLRQSCVAHLSRTAQGLTENGEAGMARFGARVHAELQRLGHRGTERPTVGQWRAWEARFRSLINRHATREDKAGTFARRLERAGEALWVFLDVEGRDQIRTDGEGPEGEGGETVQRYPANAQAVHERFFSCRLAKWNQTRVKSCGCHRNGNRCFMVAPWRVTKGAAPDAVQAARPVLPGGDEETYR